MTREERKLKYRYADGRIGNGRICPRPGKMLKNTFGDDYVAHLIAGSTRIVIRVNAQQKFRFEHATRGDRGFFPREEGPAPCGGRAGAVRFLMKRADELGVTYNKIVYATSA